VARIACPITGRCASRADGGSRQTLDSIGSSVKLTNRLTSTATTTVMPKG
jgi:class 3 adenylate cyclase